MFRIKIVTPTNDCHYFYEEVKETALEAVQEFTKELEGLDCSIFLYKETKYGHIRIL